MNIVGGVTRYPLHVLLNFIDEDHFYRQKTKKIYRNYYANGCASGPPAPQGHNKRKSFLAETEVFSDERSIQEIRGVLGKMSQSNKQLIIDVLQKNHVSVKNHDVLIQLLHQYATLCLEWNDLYLAIYDKVYYQADPDFYKKLYDLCWQLVLVPKEYDDPDQKMFFRLSNIELFCKLGVQYVNYRKDSLLKWSFGVLATIHGLCKAELYAPDWISIYIHFATIYVRSVSVGDKRHFRRKVKAEPHFADLQALVDDGQLPVKIQFKWMDFTDLLNAD